MINLIPKLVCNFILISMLSTCSRTDLAQNNPQASPTSSTPSISSGTPPSTSSPGKRSLAIVEDGEAIIEPGIFEPGCSYGESLSDHAPIIYGDFGTWNIASPINSNKIPGPNGIFFLNHKFRLDNKENLVDLRKNKVGILGSSEVNRIGKINKANEFYINRVEEIAKTIKKFFQDRKDLEYIALQEIPGPLEVDIHDERIQDLIRKAFAPGAGEKQELAITFYDAPGGGKKIPDVGIAHKKDADLTQESADINNRFVPFCSKKEKSCYVSIHMPFTVTDKDLNDRCIAIHAQALALRNKGYTNIRMAGDFNTNANRIAAVCKDSLSFSDASISIHTSKGNKGSSCNTNNGDMGANNIDLLIEIRFE